MAQGCGWQPCGLASHDGEGHWDILTATKIQKKVTEKCGLERASSRFRAMTPPRTAETPAITSTTCGAWAAEAASPGEQETGVRTPPGDAVCVRGSRGGLNQSKLTLPKMAVEPGGHGCAVWMESARVVPRGGPAERPGRELCTQRS